MSTTEDELEDPPWKGMDKKELERFYSPSVWSKRFPGDKVIELHVEVARSISESVRKTLPGRIDVPYGERSRAKLDVFGEDLPKDSYILVYVHGGYWQLLEKDLSLYPVEPLYHNGVLSIILGYTLAPQVSLADIIEEIREGVKWSCNLARDRGSKGVILMGWSAGGHLITEVLSSVHNKKEKDALGCVRGFITLAGVFDVRPLVFTGENKALNLNETTAWNLSSLKKTATLSEHFPRIKGLVTYGENDSPEFKRQSEQYCKILKKNNMTVSTIEVPDVDHFNLVENLNSSNYSLTLKIKEFIQSLNESEK